MLGCVRCWAAARARVRRARPLSPRPSPGLQSGEGGGVRGNLPYQTGGAGGQARVGAAAAGRADGPPAGDPGQQDIPREVTTTALHCCPALSWPGGGSRCWSSSPPGSTAAWPGRSWCGVWGFTALTRPAWPPDPAALSSRPSPSSPTPAPATAGSASPAPPSHPGCQTRNEFHH